MYNDKYDADYPCSDPSLAGSGLATVALALLAIVAIGIAALYFNHEPIPDLSAASEIDSRTFDERYAPVISNVTAQLDGVRQSLTAPSISIAVAIDGELVWAESRGYADLESLRAATLDTTYLIGSVSKSITGGTPGLLS